LAAGAHDIYQITRAMRNGEVGCYHNPEFTLIEWYRVGDTHHQQMQVVEDLVVHVFRSAIEFRDNVQPQRTQVTGLLATQVEQPFERLTYDEAFEKHTGSRVLGLATSQLAELARRLKIVTPAGLAEDDRDGWLNLLLAERVEPNLGRDRPVFLYDYPASQAALARVRQEEIPVAERFELYVQGIEICNGYHELTDPQEFRQRIQRQTDLRDREGFPKLPQENRLLDAMEAGLPDCAGVALGFDRLVMSSLGAASVAEVMAFPFDRA
jgi:lysyl-tRNA synthetase class 2